MLMGRRRTWGHTHNSVQSVYVQRRRNPSPDYWQDQYLEWQARDRSQAEKRAELEAEKKRIFGGVDEGLRFIDGD